MQVCITMETNAIFVIIFFQNFKNSLPLNSLTKYFSHIIGLIYCNRMHI